jgi:protein SCO1/2
MIRTATVIGALSFGGASFAAGLPFDVGGAFTLTDQSGAQHSQSDPDGWPQLLFFGYANCQQICSVALPLMAEIAADMGAAGMPVRPVLITVDPARDTVETIGPPLEYLHPDFIGLTGTPEALQVAYDAFQVEFEHIFDDPQYGPIFSHGSFIYLLSPTGEVLSLLPPILSVEQAGDILRARLKAAG